VNSPTTVDGLPGIDPSAGRAWLQETLSEPFWDADGLPRALKGEHMAWVLHPKWVYTFRGVDLAVLTWDPFAGYRLTVRPDKGSKPYPGRNPKHPPWLQQVADMLKWQGHETEAERVHGLRQINDSCTTDDQLGDLMAVRMVLVELRHGLA